MDRNWYKSQLEAGKLVGQVIADLLTKPVVTPIRTVAPEAPRNLRVQSAAEASFQAWAAGGTLEKTAELSRINETACHKPPRPKGAATIRRR